MSPFCSQKRFCIDIKIVDRFARKEIHDYQNRRDESDEQTKYVQFSFAMNSKKDILALVFYAQRLLSRALQRVRSN
jgi:hypothetical protein